MSHWKETDVETWTLYSADGAQLGWVRRAWGVLRAYDAEVPLNPGGLDPVIGEQFLTVEAAKAGVETGLPEERERWIGRTPAND